MPKSSKKPPKENPAAALEAELGFSVSPQQLYAWRKAGLPVDDPPELRRQLELSAQSEVGAPQNLKEALLREQVLKTRAERLIKERTLAELEGRLVDREEVASEHEAVAALISAELHQLPEILPPMLDGMDAAAQKPKIARHVAKAIRGLHKALDAVLPPEPE